MKPCYFKKRDGVRVESVTVFYFLSRYLLLSSTRSCHFPICFTWVIILTWQQRIIKVNSAVSLSIFLSFRKRVLPIQKHLLPPPDIWWTFSSICCKTLFILQCSPIWWKSSSARDKFPHQFGTLSLLFLSVITGSSDGGRVDRINYASTTMESNLDLLPAWVEYVVN